MGGTGDTFSRRKIAYLTNVTADMVVAKLKKYCEVYTPDGFDAWMPEVMNDNSPIYGRGKDAIDAIFLVLDGTEFYGLSYEEISERIYLWESAVQRLAKAESYVFLSTVDISESRIKSYSEIREKSKWQYYWDNFIQNVATSSKSVFIVDIESCITDIGRNNFYSPKMWYMGSMPYSKIGIEAIVNEIRLAMKAAFEPRRKIAVVDLDNTLWGGVIGEDGVDGIVLSSNNEGARYYDFQRRLLEMKQHGVVLGVDSKNNEEDAGEAFRHPNMVLKLDDFVSTKINWRDKASNIKEMENDLNLTEGAFVFIDDNPVEREKVKGLCPDVEVLEFPADTVELPRFIERAYREHFQILHTTDEDVAKTQMYQAEVKRHTVEAAALDLDSYIKALEITADIHKMKVKEIERVHQLVNKANQFNLTTKRYSLSEIRELDTDKAVDIFTVHTADKFGDNELVGVVIVKRSVDDGLKVNIDTFLISCRMMGRKLENVIMGCLVNHYKGDYEYMTAYYVKTAKNKPVEDLYECLGFKLDGSKEGMKSYSLDLAQDYKRTVPYKSVLFNGQVVERR